MDMSISTILGILGVSVSLLFGAWGVSLALSRRYPGEITFVREQTIALFDSIVRNLPELAVLYKKAPVSPNVVLIRGALVNTGRKDISSSMIDKPITLALPSGSHFLSASVISASSDVKASLAMPNANEIVLTNGLLRCNEFVRFQALAELAPQDQAVGKAGAGSLEERLEKFLKFEHRIEDTRAVRRVELRATKRLGSRVQFYILLLVLGTISSVGVIFLSGPLGLSKRFAYDLQIGTNQTARVTARARGESVRVSSLDGTYAATLPIAEFNSRLLKPPVIVEDRSWLSFLAFLIVLYVLVPGLVVSLALRNHFANKKLARLLGLDRPLDTQVRHGHHRPATGDALGAGPPQE